MTIGPREGKLDQNLWDNLLPSIYIREVACQSTFNIMKLLLCLELSIRTPQKKQSYELVLYKRANPLLSHLLIDSNYKMTTTDMYVLFYGLCPICQNYTEQYKGAAAHTVTTRLQYTKVRAGGRW